MPPVSVPNSSSPLLREIVLFPVKKKTLGTPPINADGSAAVMAKS